MLADDIALLATMLHPRDLWFDTTRTLAARINYAERLVLRRDVVQTAQHLACSRPSSMRDAIDLARPPYPVTWIEWADSDKREIQQMFGLLDVEGQTHPTRVGALITPADIRDVAPGERLEDVLREADPTLFEVELAWTHGGPNGVSISVAAMRMNLGELSAEDIERKTHAIGTIKSRKDIPGSYWYLYRDRPSELEAYADIVSRVDFRPAFSS